MSIESRSRQYGKVFDHWQIREFLGSGSGGKTAVFRLTRVDSSRGVSALKVVNLIEERGSFDELSDFHRKEYEAAREECSRSAEQEVWLMDELRGNTNIVDYLDHTFVDWSEADCFGRDLLIRMELLTDLRSELRNGRMFSEAEVLKIGRDICVALELCHNKNILHRDVKPENIFRNRDGAYKLGDFGVSRVLDACPGAVASTGIGTYEYWPAEQMTGSYDKRVDIYSLGLVLYELSNRNRLPFASSTYVTGKEVSLRLAGNPLPEPVGASLILKKVILKACSFKPEERYQSAEELLKALDWVNRGDNGQNAPHFETVPAQPAAEIAFETQPAQRSSFDTQPAQQSLFETQPVQRQGNAFETQPVQSAKATSGAFLNDQSHPKKRLPIVLAALLLCVVGIIAGQRIWMVSKYSAAKELLEEGKYKEAIAAFEALGDYRDSPEQLETARLAAEEKAEESYPATKEPTATVETLEDSQASTQQAETTQPIAEEETGENDPKEKSTKEPAATVKTIRESQPGTQQTESTQPIVEEETEKTDPEEKPTKEPAATVETLRESQPDTQPTESSQPANTLNERKKEVTVSAGPYHTVGLKTDGTVVAMGGNNYGQCDVSSWTGIAAVNAGLYHTIGLKTTGTVVAAGYNAFGQCDVDDWTDIVAVSAGLNHTVGLKADGTAVAVGKNEAHQCDVGSWTGLTAVSAGSDHTVGLKSDGTVVAAGSNGDGQCNVEDWTDIVAISAGWSCTVGLKSDGTVVAVGNNGDGQCSVESWRNIVSVSAGLYHVLGLKYDGTVVAAGSNSFGQCDVGNWKNIVAISAGSNQTVCLKSNGTLITAGSNIQRQLDVWDWNDIMLPESN